jgi:aldehyde:ferredoxin oxidoreductase
MDKSDIRNAMLMFYEEAGWDKETGSPTRETYRRLGLSEVAAELDKKGLVA